MTTTHQAPPDLLDTNTATTTSGSVDTVTCGSVGAGGAAAGEGQRLRDRFPPRPVRETWQRTQLSRQEAQELLAASPLVTQRGTHGPRAMLKILDWLSAQPGATWQQRWLASGAQDRDATDWADLPVTWLAARGGRSRRIHRLDAFSGLLMVIAADLIRPDLAWLLTRRSGHLARVMAQARDPEGFALLQRTAEADPALHPQTASVAFSRIATILAAKGGAVTDVTVGDCVELVDTMSRVQSHGGVEKRLFYRLLHQAGVFPPDAPATLRAFTTTGGQQTVAELVDRVGIVDPEVRDLLVDYLRERQPRLDYSSLVCHADQLARLFWRDLERHHPGINSLHLPADVATAWKQRIAVKTVARHGNDGQTVLVEQPRASATSILLTVRGFYLDLAHWAAEDPARWARWAVPCPIRDHDIPTTKSKRRHKADMDARTRARLPVLPTLVAHVNQSRLDAAAALQAARSAPPGQTFTVGERTLERAVVPHTRSSTAVWVSDPAIGRRRDLDAEAGEAFWTWAVIEVLRHTGIRIEELLELSHHSLIQYRLPSTGELVPLLQIAPSKSDAERLLVISPELADVLSAIVVRVRGTDGAIPHVPWYDVQERIWRDPQPLLFQRRHGDELKALTRPGVRELINQALLASGLTDSNQQPLKFTPHDFRRIFITDAILNGLPPHIAQIICGHADINTTIGYKAVYPQESITAHRAFLARRRGLRPSEEYRQPSTAEWEEFIGHFEKRKVSLGTCARAYNTTCEHEHACIRCPVLWPDPAQRARLLQIRDNLTARIDEAEREGWHGEIEGLRISLAAADNKLQQMNYRDTSAVPVHLGMPSIGPVAGRVSNEAP